MTFIKELTIITIGIAVAVACWAGTVMLAYKIVDRTLPVVHYADK